MTTTYTWRSLAYSLLNNPLGRASHSLNVLRNKAYVFSGESEPRKPIDAVLQVFDLLETKWLHPIPPSSSTPSPRVGHASATCQDKIYIFGGRGGPEMSPLDATLWSFDASANEWAKVEAAGDVPASRSYHSMTACENYVYLFGGCLAEGRANDLYLFDPRTSSWEQLPSHPDLPARGGAGLAYLQGQVIVYGGFNGKELDDLWAFNISQKAWSRIPPSGGSEVPCPRSVMGFVALTDLGKFVAIMGEKNPAPKELGHAGAGRYANDIWLLDIHADNTATWTRALPSAASTQAPTPRGWFPATTWNGQSVIIHGGYDGERRDDGIFCLSFASPSCVNQDK